MADLNEIRRVYEMLDKNGVGALTVDEICGFINKLGISMSGEDLRFIVRSKGQDDCSDSLRFKEFVDLYEFIFNREQDEGEYETGDLMETFKIFDQNGDGYISCEELQRVLSTMGLIPQTQHPKQCEQMIRTFDLDCNGVLDFAEFKTMMSSQLSA
ncbi:hypothetical protein SUGI_0210090 [Cryptomeria japonica]|uniref:calmodulin-like protein 7 n=1 Tax=Cryptomeria japonica TaxID=3369 RepID=UPI002408BC90|nr:calmodulin-like protein 7 [Cryptomeria japonica]GLJ13309.1 hypothetical protein SUGI_0210090 [Cryptomeria japonica]